MRLSILLVVVILVACEPTAKRPTRPSTEGTTTSEATARRQVDEDTRKATLALRSLTDPEMLAFLDSRSVFQSKRKACYWLTKGADIEAAIADTPRGRLAKASIRRNVAILRSLGCLTPENLEKLKLGRAPLITRGPYAGETAEVDHIVPVAGYPEFAGWFGNLEIMPMSLNGQKGDSMGPRQISHLTTLRLARDRGRGY
jgi:hypothetical protein